MSSIRILVLTVSDRCSRGEAEDVSGPTAVDLLTAHFAAKGIEASIRLALVPDDMARITRAVTTATDVGGVAAPQLILTTGGTGFGVRDVTPEAVRPLLHKEAPGIVHAMLHHSLPKTKFAWLSRAVAGVRGRTLIITLPGSPRAVAECLAPLLDSGLEHAVRLASGEDDGHPSGVVAVPAPASSAALAALSSAARGGVPDVTRRARVSTYPMVSMADALALIATHVPTTENVVTLPAIKALGHVLAARVVSAFNHPPFRASIKDGYAVVSGDGPGVYPVAGALIAGSQPDGFVLMPGHVCRVNTGGPVPPGADAVVQVEDTKLVDADHVNGREETVSVLKAVKPGHDIRPIGCDLAAGGAALEKGTVVRAPEVGLALSVGAPTLQVLKRPVVAVVSTGDELVDAAEATFGAEPPPGKIFDSNRSMLLAALAELGFETVDGGIARDNLHDTRERLERAWRLADVVISSGGVSMGEVDCVKTVLVEGGATVHFGRVNMKPGKPTTFATRSGKAFFALPGNPVSAMVCFHLFVVPALRRWSGLPAALPTLRATLLHDVKLDAERPEYHRCVLKHNERRELVASSTGIQASHRLLSMSGANGMMELPAGDGVIAAGEQVNVVVIGEVL